MRYFVFSLFRFFVFVFFLACAFFLFVLVVFFVCGLVEGYMTKVVIRTAYDGVVVDAGLFFPKDAVGAKQSFKEECDINNIVKSFSPLTGEFSHMNLKAPIFGDATGMGFREMMEAVAEAQSSFEQLPAELRARFDNDPREFVEFCSDPRNKGELVELGLAVKGEEVAAVTPPEPVPAVGTALAKPALGSGSAEPAVPA